ncbi:retrovirus-related pol polyprotein from transposon TNT 1-94 [Tanacetum coccineum]
MRKVWKPTGKVFSKTGYSWKPTGRTFTIVGNRFPLNRITSTKVVPLKETTIAQVVTPTLGILIYSRRPKATRSVGSSSKIKNVESKTSNSKEPKQPWGSTVYDVPSSSLDNYSKKHFHKPKAEDSIQEKLYLLHMDLCGPMRVQSINGRKYILVIIDDFYRFTWVKILRSKDEVPKIIIKFLKMIQVRLNATVCNIRTDNGTEFVNQTLMDYYEEYELLHDRKLNLSYLHVFGALCYPTNDGEDLRKLKPKAAIVIFVGYAPAKKAFRIYNKRTRIIIETIHVDFDELTAMASEQVSSGPRPKLLTPGIISSRLVPNIPSSTPYVPPTKNDWEILFQPMFDEYLNPPPCVNPQVPAVNAPEPLKKALYGLKQAPCAWYDLLSSFLLSQKFTKGTVDPTLFVRREGKDILLVQIYVDDIIFAFTKPDLCETYGMETYEPTDTSIVEKSKLDEDPQRKSVDPIRYRGMIGTLIYLTASRPDLVFDLCMSFADANHAGCQDTRKSMSGSMQLLGDRLRMISQVISIDYLGRANGAENVDLSGVASCDGCARWVLEDQLLSASLLMCLGKRDYVERIPSGNGLYTTLPPNMVDPHLMDTVAEWVVNEINVTLFAKMCMCSATVVENAATIAMAITGSIHQAEIWATKGLLDKAKGMYLVWRSSRIKVGSLSGDCDVEKNGKWSCIYAVGSQEYQMVCTRLDKASTDVGSLKGNLQHMEALPTTKAGYMTFIEAWKKEIWLKGLLT